MKTQYVKPILGARIKVVAKYRNTFIYRTNDWFEETYVGTVLPNHKLTPANSFVLNTPEDVNTKIREIDMGFVQTLDYLDGQVAKKESITSDTQVFLIAGSKGSQYAVTRQGKKYTCTCSGFQFRKNCKHIEEVKQ